MRIARRATWSAGITAITAAVVLSLGLSSLGAASASTTKHLAPILIGTIDDGPATNPPIQNLGEVQNGIGAAVKAINKAGGIHGHMLKLVWCDDAGNPNTGAACARTMVSDKVAAVVGDTAGEGATYLPVLAAAHIAVIGDYAITSADLTCTTCFPLISSVSVVAGEGNLLAWAGNTNISMPYVNDPAAAGLPTLTGFGLAPYGLKLLNQVPIPANAPDMSSYVASTMAGGTTGVVLGLLGSDGARFVSTAQSLGFNNVTYVSDCSNLSEAISAGFASALQGVYAVCLFLPPTDTSNATVRALDAQMKAYNKKAKIIDVTENAWVATYLFKQVAMSLKNVTAANVLAKMPSITFHNGLLPAISFAKSVSPIPGFVLYNNDVLLTQVNNGKFVPLDGKFSDPFVKNTLP